MKTIKLMIFDFDGTLVASGDDLAASVNHTLGALGIPHLDRDEIIGFIGDGVAKLVERALGDEHRHRFHEAIGIFRDHYAEHLIDTTTLYPGVHDTLEYFRDTKKVIVTNKLYAYTIKIAEELGIVDCFEEIYGADSSPAKKPDKELLLPLLERYGAERTDTVVIGDGINDILLAKNSGTMSCALLNGLGDRARLLSLRPDYCCEDITELRELFA